MGNAAASLLKFKVLFLDGRLEAYRKPMKAAELMVEYPGQFVCDSSYLKVGHRIHGLLADEQLQRHKFYYLLPMELLYSVLTHEEFTFLNFKASKATKKLAKIFPEFCMSFPSELKILEPHNHLLRDPQPIQKQRSWRPALDTIHETL